MLQYLLNATAIWLLSLTLFDLFLRKESYHNYNRFYLFFTFFLGIFLPLWQWQDDSLVFQSSLQRPVERLLTAKQNMITTSTISAAKTDWEVYLWYIYLAGVLISSLLLIAEVVKIIRLYHSGSRSRQGSGIIIQTGKDHSPFSLFNMIFVSSRDNYNPEEWDMLIAHEQMHGMLLHFIDVLVMQLARIVFWFHPLVYIYNTRLVMQHEYQADRVSAAKPQFYGQFLIEQALLQNAPSLTHSFNRSPIKNRIVMLTRTSSFAAKTKMLVFIPLALVCIVCFSKNSFSQKFEKNGNIVTYHGNKFELSEPETDTIVIVNPVTGKEETKIATKVPYPVKMNGSKIYAPWEIKNNASPALGTPYNAESALNAETLKEYLLSNLKEELAKLKDDTYALNLQHVVVDEKGRIVYFEYNGISVFGAAGNDPNKSGVDKSVQTRITRQVYTLLNNAPAHTPASVNAHDVPAMISDYDRGMFTIKDRKVSSL